MSDMQMDQLDGFRRGAERSRCAVESSRSWRPPIAWTNGTRADNTDPLTFTDETRTWMALPSVATWRAAAWPWNEVDIIAANSALLANQSTGANRTLSVVPRAQLGVVGGPVVNVTAAGAVVG